MKKQIIFMMLALFSMSSIAQKTEWLNGAGHKLSECDGSAMVVDSKGNVYIIGKINGKVNFNVGKDETEAAAVGHDDVFILKQDSKGNIKWVKTIGGKNSVIPTSAAIDVYDNIYITGMFTGKADFDPGEGLFEMTGNKFSSAFILKLNASGNFAWANSFDGFGSSISADANGNVYATGYFNGTVDFDPSSKTYELSVEAKKDKDSYSPPSNTFISKYGSKGELLWVKKFAEKGGYINSKQIVVDSKGGIFLTGDFDGTVDLNPSEGVNQITASKKNTSASFILKLDSMGNFNWAKNYGLADGLQISLDKKDNIYISGGFNGTIDFDSGSNKHIITTPKKEYSFFVLKLDNDGIFTWIRNNDGKLRVVVKEDLRTEIVPAIKSILIDDNDNIYLCGHFSGILDFGLNDNRVESKDDKSSTFICKLDSKGDLVWAKKLVNKDYNSGKSLALDNKESIYITGSFKFNIQDEDEIFKLSIPSNNCMYIMKIKDKK